MKHMPDEDHRTSEAKRCTFESPRHRCALSEGHKGPHWFQTAGKPLLPKYLPEIPIEEGVTAPEDHAGPKLFTFADYLAALRCGHDEERAAIVDWLRTFAGQAAEDYVVRYLADKIEQRVYMPDNPPSPRTETPEADDVLTKAKHYLNTWFWSDYDEPWDDHHAETVSLVELLRPAAHPRGERAQPPDDWEAYARAAWVAEDRLRAENRRLSAEAASAFAEGVKAGRAEIEAELERAGIHRTTALDCIGFDAPPCAPDAVGELTAEADRLGMYEKARLDADGTAKPKTEIVGVFQEGKVNFYQNAESLIARQTDAPASSGEEPGCGTWGRVSRICLDTGEIQVTCRLPEFELRRLALLMDSSDVVSVHFPATRTTQAVRRG